MGQMGGANGRINGVNLIGKSNGRGKWVGE